MTWTDLTGTGLREGGREIAGQYLLACLAKGDYERQTTRFKKPGTNSPLNNRSFCNAGPTDRY